MEDPDTDDALLTATEKARAAAERLRKTQVESPAIVPEARTVDRRVEDVHVLAGDAAAAAED